MIFLYEYSSGTAALRDLVVSRMINLLVIELKREHV